MKQKINSVCDCLYLIAVSLNQNNNKRYRNLVPMSSSAGERPPTNPTIDKINKRGIRNAPGNSSTLIGGLGGLVPTLTLRIEEESARAGHVLTRTPAPPPPPLPRGVKWTWCVMLQFRLRNVAVVYYGVRLKLYTFYGCRSKAPIKLDAVYTALAFRGVIKS